MRSSTETLSKTPGFSSVTYFVGPVATDQSDRDGGAVRDARKLLGDCAEDRERCEERRDLDEADARQ
jgi:hypothetical protein